MDTYQADFAEAMQAIGYFERTPAIAVAVSGGGDSMALLLLASDWVKANGGTLTALTVDHGLRPESAQEAATVAGWCAARGITHHTLTWHPPALDSGIQAAAREARYRLMAQWCREHHVLHLLTAHHQGDQAETLFFRLMRGSGVEGLSGMGMVIPFRHIRLLRPLLGMDQARLKERLVQAGQAWVEDPSNQHPRYARTQIRTHLAATGKAEALVEQAADIAGSFGRVRRQSDLQFSRHAATYASLYPAGYATLKSPALKEDEPYTLKLLAALMQTVSGRAYPPRTEKLERLLADLRSMSGSDAPKNRTFGGCLFRTRPRLKDVLICRESKAVAAPLVLVAGAPQYWDGRFFVEATESLTVRPLEAEGSKQLKNIEKTVKLKQLPPPVMATIPSFWKLEELVAVPHIGYRRQNDAAPACIARFQPAKPLAGAPFWAMNRRR